MFVELIRRSADQKSSVDWIGGGVDGKGPKEQVRSFGRRESYETAVRLGRQMWWYSRTTTHLPSSRKETTDKKVMGVEQETW